MGLLCRTSRTSSRYLLSKGKEGSAPDKRELAKVAPLSRRVVLYLFLGWTYSIPLCFGTKEKKERQNKRKQNSLMNLRQRSYIYLTLY